MPRAEFKRIAPGYYATEDDRWEICRHRTDPDYGGKLEWTASLLGGRAVLDPVPTLAEAKEAVVAAVAAEASDPVPC